MTWLGIFKKSVAFFNQIHSATFGSHMKPNVFSEDILFSIGVGGVWNRVERKLSSSCENKSGSICSEEIISQRMNERKMRKQRSKYMQKK